MEIKKICQVYWDAAERSEMEIWDVASGVVMAREGHELEGEYEMEW